MAGRRGEAVVLKGLSGADHSQWCGSDDFPAHGEYASEKAGFGEHFCELAKKLPEDCKIILIGLSEKQIKELPKEIMGITRTENAVKLAEYYSMADVFVNATLEDNFPTTNLEALSCGTSVITFETGGSPESLDETCGRVVKKGDAEALLQAVLAEREHPMRKEDCLTRAAQYEKNDRFMEYTALYHRMCGQGE